MADLSALSPFRGLQDLTLIEYAGSNPLPALGNIAATLRSLELVLCPHLADLGQISSFESLRSLTLDGCDGPLVDGHPPVLRIGPHDSLEILEISGCRAFTVDRLPSLRHLIVGEMELQSFESFRTAALQNLMTLKLINMEMASVDGLEYFQTASELYLIASRLPDDFGGFGGFGNLTHVEIRDCYAWQVRSLSSLASNRNINTIVLKNCDYLESFDGIGDLRDLTLLSLVGLFPSLRIGNSACFDEVPFDGIPAGDVELAVTMFLASAYPALGAGSVVWGGGRSPGSDDGYLD
jgi:hypothetical protein